MNELTPRPVGRNLQKGAHAFAILFAVLYTLAWLIAGPRIHTMESAIDCEADGYSYMADQLIQGDLPSSGYHPIGYPMMTSIVARVTGDSFSAARLLSTLGMGWLIYLTFLLGRRLFCEQVGLCAMLLMAANGYVSFMGLHASSDMTFAALAQGVLLLCLSLSERHTRARVVGLAALFGWTYSVRYFAISLLPAILLSLALTPALGRPLLRTVALRWAQWAGWALLFLAPLLALSYRQHGTFMHNDNWRNLALKLYAGGEYAMLGSVTEAHPNLWAVIAASPVLFLKSGALEIYTFMAGPMGLRNLLGEGLPGMIASVLFLVGICAYGIRSPGKRSILLLAFMGVQVALIGFMFIMSPRLLLAIAPAGCVIVSWTILYRLFAPAGDGARRMRAAGQGLIGLLMVGTIYATSGYPRFLSGGEPRNSVAVAQDLESREGHGGILASTITPLILQRYVESRVVYIHDATPVQRADPMRYMDHLQESLHRMQADYLLLDRLTFGSRPPDLWQGANTPEWLERIHADDDTVLYRVHPLPPYP